MIRNLLLLFLISSAHCTLPGCSGAAGVPLPRAEKGVLDLRGADLLSGRTYELGGIWEFVFGRYLEPGAGLCPDALPLPDLIRFPGTWEGAVYQGGALPGTGFATYRLTILLGENRPDRLALLIPGWETAYTLYADGQAAAAAGRPGTDPESTLPQWKPLLTDFPVKGSTLELILHIANFHHARGGPAMMPLLGSPEAIREKREKGVAMKLFTFGSLVMIGFYHIAVFFLRRNEKSALYFSLFCLLMAVRSLVINEHCILMFLPEISWEFHIRLTYLSFILALPLFILFVHSLFPGETGRVLNAVFSVIAAAYAALVVSTPPVYYTGLLTGFQMVIIAAGIYCIFILGLAASRKKDTALLFLGAFALYFACILNDIGYHRGYVHTAYIVPYGFLSFIFFQSIILARHYSRAFIKIEALLREQTRLEGTTNKLKHLAHLDPLTGLANRRRLDEYLEQEWKRSLREGRTISCIMMDVDYFKAFNDHFGHQAGDDTLRQIAGSLKKSVQRPADLAARYGGEEFAALLPDTPLEGAVQLAEIIRRNLLALKISGPPASPFHHVTLSLGCASVMPAAGKTPGDLMAMADRALYRAKQNGRNRTEFELETHTET